jgi:hypothetical protein
VRRDELDELKLDQGRNDDRDDESAKLPTLYKIFKSLRERICDLTPRRSDMNEETLRELSVRERSSCHQSISYFTGASFCFFSYSICTYIYIYILSIFTYIHIFKIRR